MTTARDVQPGDLVGGRAVIACPAGRNDEIVGIRWDDTNVVSWYLPDDDITVTGHDAARIRREDGNRCGSRDGYLAHRRRKEDACRPCKDAWAAYVRQHRHDRRRQLTRQSSRLSA